MEQELLGPSYTMLARPLWYNEHHVQFSIYIGKVAGSGYYLCILIGHHSSLSAAGNHSFKFRILKFGYCGNSFMGLSLITAQGSKNKVFSFQLHTAIVIDQWNRL